MGLRSVSLRLFAVSCFGLCALLSEAAVVVAAPQVSKLAVQAADAAFKGRFSEANDLAERSRDPAAIKLVELVYLRDHWKTAGYRRITAFLDQAPQWPLSETLRKRAELSIYLSDMPADTVLAHFATHQPASPQGKLALARAELAGGNRETARKLVRRVWIEETLDQALERKVRDEFGKLLTSDDHRQRMSRLIYKQETNAAVRTSKLLSKDEQAAALAAQALIRQRSGAEKSYNALPASMRQQL